MKRLSIGILIVLIIFIGIYYAVGQHTSVSISSNATSTGTGTTAFHPDPSNSTFVIDGESAKLANGSAENVSTDGLTIETDLTDTVGYGDMNGDGKDDAAVILASTNPVTGFVTTYLGGYVSSLLGYEPTNTLALGTQITPESVSVRKGEVTVTYLGRPANAPLSEAPSVETTKTFSYVTADNSLEAK